MNSDNRTINLQHRGEHEHKKHNKKSKCRHLLIIALVIIFILIAYIFYKKSNYGMQEVNLDIDIDSISIPSDPIDQLLFLRENFTPKNKSSNF